MDHDYINQSGLIDDYLMGRLEPDEVEGFEEHFIDCPECIARLKTSRDFIEDLRRMAAQQAGLPDGYAPRVEFGYLGKVLSSGRLALAACCLIVIAALGILLQTKQIRQLQSEVDQAKDASSQIERRHQEESQTASVIAKKRQEAEKELTERVDQLEAKVENDEMQMVGKAAQNRGWTRPLINLPIVALSSVRGGQSGSSKSVNEIVLPHSSGGFAISLPLQGELTYKDYRLTIFNGRGRPIWRHGGFKPDRYDSLALGLNSSFFPPGNYLLRIEGVTAKRETTTIGDYPLHISKSSVLSPTK